MTKEQIRIEAEVYNKSLKRHPSSEQALTEVLVEFAERLQNLQQCNVMRSLPSLPSDKDINEKAKTHQQQFPNNSPMRSYKTGYHHALHDIEKAMPS